MPLVEEPNVCQYHIQRIDAGCVVINNEEYRQSLIVTSDTLITNWTPANVDEIRPEHWQPLIATSPDIILLGTGTSAHFPHADLLQPLYELGYSVECMTTEAACRTFVALSSEGRKIAAALIIN